MIINPNIKNCSKQIYKYEIDIQKKNLNIENKNSNKTNFFFLI